MRFFVLAETIKVLGLSIHLPSIAPYVAMGGILIFILSILPMLIWIERVVLALIQDRSGPNRVGPRGLLQTSADALKLFFKEDSRPRNVDVRVYYLAPMLAVATAFSAGAVIPTQFLTVYKNAVFSIPDFAFTSGGAGLMTLPVTPGNINIGLLYILAFSSLQVYGVVLAGWSSNNKYSLLGGLRASAQLISYELSMGLALLCVILMAGSLKLDDIVASQNILPFPGAPEVLRGSVFTWYWIRTLGVPVLLYTIAMVAECNRAPFDLPEAESELIAGFFTEYTSMKFAMFFTAEYVAMLTVSALNAVMFWGGPLAPINFNALAGIPYIGILFIPLAIIPGHIWLIIKVMMGIFLYTWLRGSLPRLRYDALMALGWKKMLPTGLVWLFLLAGMNLGLDIVFPKPSEAAVTASPETSSEKGHAVAKSSAGITAEKVAPPSADNGVPAPSGTVVYPGLSDKVDAPVPPEEVKQAMPAMQPGAPGGGAPRPGMSMP